MLKKNKPIWGVSMPYMYSQYFMRNKPHLWDGMGFTRELTEEHKAKIKELEETYAKQGTKVIAVVDGYYLLDEEKVNMVSYVYTSNEYEPWVIDADRRIIGFYALVDNKTWDIQESGSIGLYERVGCVRRAY